MRINLLPPEIHERQQARRRTIAVASIGLIVLVALGAFYVLQTFRLSDVEDDIQAQETSNGELQAQISDLQDIAQLEQQIATTRGLLDSLLADRVIWSGVLRDVSQVIPSQAWLDGLTGSAGAPADSTVEPTPPTSGLVGQIQFSGFAFEHRDVALWLTRLEDVRGFINPWLATSTKTDVGGTEVVQFTSTVDLTDQVLKTEEGQS
jgi:Tfp pilus assembly protein PilN